jgi:hypothetical protein
VDQSTALQLAADELEQRSIGYRPIEILDYKPTEPRRAVLAPEGSITVFIAREGDDTLDHVRRTVTEGGDAGFAEGLITRFGNRERKSYYRAYRLLRRAPSFAEVRYGSRTLGTNLFPPPDTGLLVLENPYNGGQLEPGGLTLVEHVRDDMEGRLDAVALRHEPLLTAA